MQFWIKSTNCPNSLFLFYFFSSFLHGIRALENIFMATDPSSLISSIAEPNPTSSSISSKFLNLCDPSNPYRLDNGDNPTLNLVTDLLHTDNYATWSRAMHRALRTKNKLVLSVVQSRNSCIPMTLFLSFGSVAMIWWCPRSRIPLVLPSYPTWCLLTMLAKFG